MKDDDTHPRRAPGRPTAAVSDRDKTALRLRIARFRAGYATLAAAERLVENAGIMSARTYRGYESNHRPLPVRLIETLERLFDIKAGWLEHGAGESKESLERAVAELEREAGERVRDLMSAPHQGRGEKGSALAGVNQLTPQQREVVINPSHLVPTGRIPVLLADEITAFLAGQRDDLMAGPTLPVSEEFSGPDHFCYEIGPSDTSMVGAEGHSFPPRTALIINTNAQVWQDETPPFYVLARRRGMKGWLFRRLEAALPLSVAAEFTLRALNPAIEPIRVSDPSQWEIAGRLVADQRRY